MVDHDDEPYGGVGMPPRVAPHGNYDSALSEVSLLAAYAREIERQNALLRRKLETLERLARAVLTTSTVATEETTALWAAMRISAVDIIRNTAEPPDRDAVARMAMLKAREAELTTAIADLHRRYDPDALRGIVRDIFWRREGQIEVCACCGMVREGTATFAIAHAASGCEVPKAMRAITKYLHGDDSPDSAPPAHWQCDGCDETVPDAEVKSPRRALYHDRKSPLGSVACGPVERVRDPVAEVEDIPRACIRCCAPLYGESEYCSSCDEDNNDPTTPDAA